MRIISNVQTRPHNLPDEDSFKTAAASALQVAGEGDKSDGKSGGDKSDGEKSDAKSDAYST